MKSRDDLGDGYVPLENQFMGGSWTPLTPIMQGRSSLVVDHGGGGGGFSGQDPNYTEQRGEELLGRSNLASSQAGYNAFELDDLLDTDQMPFSFTSLLSGGDHLFQVPQSGTPASSRPLYNLNSPPTREAVGYICESSVQAVPSTPSLCRTGGRDNGFLEAITRNTGQKSDNGMQSVVASSVVNSTEVKDGSRQTDLGFDLNQTPQQKPSKKKKKFMPKVFVKDKPIRKPRKPASQEAVKPKATGTGKRKKAQKTSLKESETDKPAIGGDMSNTNLQITQKSCRKALAFDLEKTGDVGLDDSEPEIWENTCGSNSFTETRGVAGGTSGSFLDSVTQLDQTNGLVAANQPLEASTAVKLPNGSEVNHSRILARDQQPGLFTGNQQRQFPTGNKQAWLQMRNQLCGFPVGNQQPRLAMGNQQPMSLMGTPRPALASRNQQPGGLQGNSQPRLALGNQQPMYLLETPQSALASRNHQPGGLQRNNQSLFLNQQTQQTCLPAGNRQYGSPSGMQQNFMSPRGQQHGLLFDMRTQQPVSPMRGQQPCVPLMNKQPGAPKGFTHFNQMVAAGMQSSGLRPHPQSQTAATNRYMGSVSRTLNGSAGTWQRSSSAEYGFLPQDFHKGNQCIPSQERSNAEYFEVRSKALSQYSSLPTPDKAKHVEARGSKRQHDRAMGHMQNSVAHCPLLQQIAQPQNVERQNSSSTSAKHLDAAKKMKIQKVVQEKSHGVAPEVIDIEDYPTDGERKHKSGVLKAPAGKVQRGRKKAVAPPAHASEISCLVQSSADNEKCIVPKTPAKKGRPRGRKKTVPPPPHSSEIQVYEPTPAKAPSSRSKAKEKGMKSKQDSGKARGQSGELLREDCIAEIIHRLENLYIGIESREQEQNALVVYGGDGAVVPYETKKKKPRPKVDLDDETTRLWNLLMGKEGKEGDEEMNKKKEKWWEEERKVFRGRADSFIARMHLVQGDRRFSPWKGSVVDSVIGVFLTQNVTDHLSSSAFMSLAARFPPKASSKQEEENNIRSVVVEDPDGCILNLNDIPPSQEKVQTSSDTQVSGVDSGSKEQQRYCSNSGIERFSFLENSSQNLEEEVLSSQDSFDPASWPFQSSGIVGSCSGSKSDAEFSTTRSETKSPSGSVQIGSPNLSDERSLLHQESGDVQIQETSNVAQKKPMMTADLVDIEDFGMNFVPTNFTMEREMKGTLAAGKKPTSQWDSLRREVLEKHGKKERSKESMDSIDYEAIRRASVHEISDAIKERGMNYMLAVRIKDFLERIVKDHGAVDLEWLRDVHPDKAKDYLLSIRGLGLKSVECVRLLTLHNLAFPVDTNVGRIAVRLGWVPLQPLPESLQLHLLELYPVLESIQKFLWPRLCKLDQPTLYELHYQLITFGKVFCTKSKPNCNACPMRGECRHFASAYASARLALPAPEEKILTTATIPVPPRSFPPATIPMMELPAPLESFLTREAPSNGGSSEPIIEEPATPEQVYTEITESDIEDAYYNEDPDEIPTIELNITQFGKTLKEHMKRNMELQEGDMSKALVALDPSTTSIPTPKLKNISRLRTEHQVYELPDSHALLAGMDKRERDDPSPYLLAIWTPGETANSAQPPGQKCGGKAFGKMCFDEACSECNSVREANSQTVRGTLLIPCRTAMRGSFPLNGTYFQVNELFADHDSSLKPIDVPRDWIWDLPRRTVYFGTSVTSIFRGMSTEQIQYCFWRGFVCVRGFEPKTRAPRPLMARLHFPLNKLKKNQTRRSMD